MNGKPFGGSLERLEELDGRFDPPHEEDETFTGWPFTPPLSRREPSDDAEHAD